MIGAEKCTYCPPTIGAEKCTCIYIINKFPRRNMNNLLARARNLRGSVGYIKGILRGIVGIYIGGAWKVYTGVAPHSQVLSEASKMGLS